MYKNLSIVYDKLMDVDYDTYMNIVQKELGNQELSKDFLILDLGCGSGAMLKELSNYGEVYGVDNSEEMLAVASSKNQTSKLFAMDLLDIESLGVSFNFVVSAFDVFNYLEDFHTFSNGLKAVYNSMKQGATFIFDIHTPKKINYMLDSKVFAYEDEEINYIWFTYETENELEVESELTFFVKEEEGLYRKLEEYQKQRTYEIDRVIAEIKKQGFSIENYFCDFDINNRDYNNSERILFILKK